MASSSSNIDSALSFDVFLSFRGKDARHGFISHLRKKLCDQGIEVFIDSEMERGKEITPYIERVIEATKISIIVFSKNYADSTFCLDELLKIMECRESKTQIVIPIFYKIEPSEEMYEEAFAIHERTIKQQMLVEGLKSFFWRALNWLAFCLICERSEEATIKKEMKVERWKSAFQKAVELSGDHIADNCDESDIIGKITDRVWTNLMKLNGSQSKGEKLMYKSMVGHTADDIFEKIWKCLMNEKISGVGIYGMGGVGKTTIATRVYDELRERAKSFSYVCWVTVSKNLSIWKLQNEIAKSIKLDLSKEDDKLKRAAKLRYRLKSKNFVLILDDVWEAFEIEDMGIPRLAGGQKLLLTSRKFQVCKGMNCQPIKVGPLSKEESLDLFMKEHGNEIQDSVAWKGIVHSIVGECAGLPLAIIVMARRMREMVEISEWRNVLRKLKEPCKGENHEVEEQVFKPLMLSYDSLPDYQYQQCFLYCSLFPEDHLQRRDSLIEYLIGEGLVGELDSRQAELDLGNATINGLKNASLLEVTFGYFRGYYGVKYIKMHDVVRDMANIVIRENLTAQEGLKLQDLSKETKRCFNRKSVLIMKHSMLKSGVPNLVRNASELTTLSFDELLYIRELPSRFFANMQNLAVLDMSGMLNLMLLPDSISYLENLRVLLLHRCAQLKYIPSLAELKNLRYLDLIDTNLKEIPKGMELLINLRVLKMSPVHSFVSGAFLEKLSHLQILDIKKVEVEAEVLISLKKLETLRIVFYNLESLNSYFKSGHWNRLQEYFIFYSILKIGRAAEMWEEEYELKKVLFIEGLWDIGDGKGETDMTLPNNIQFLHLRFWNGPMVDVVKNSTFHNLRKLVIHHCEGQQHVFTPALVQGVLLNVEELIISDGWGVEVEEIISGEEELVSEINNYYYPTIHLPYLKSLRLRWLGNLRSIYKGRMVCPSLERISLVDCGKIERLPFCMKERNNLNRIQLQLGAMPNKCWDSLHWDDPHAKSFYQFQDDSTEEDDEALDLTLKL